MQTHYSDKVPNVSKDEPDIKISGLLEEENFDMIKGEIFIKLYDENRNLIEWKRENVIVNSAALLLCELMKNEGNPGVTHLALGTGDVGWNPLNLPAPSRTSTTLESEIYRKAYTSTQYVDGGGAPSVTRTNRADFQFDFDASEATGTLLEMGLFGGVDAATPNGGTMVNCHHVLINKGVGFSLQIIWRLTFG